MYEYQLHFLVMIHWGFIHIIYCTWFWTDDASRRTETCRR